MVESFLKKVNQGDQDQQGSREPMDSQVPQDQWVPKDHQDQEVSQVHLVQRETRVTGCLLLVRKDRRVKEDSEALQDHQVDRNIRVTPPTRLSLDHRVLWEKKARKVSVI